jgi:hypothetical protein
MIETTSDAFAPSQPPQPTVPWYSRRVPRWFIVWTVCSALVTWLGLTIAEGISAERCRSDGLAWNWKAWSCEFRAGPLSLPPGLRRSH